MWPVIALKVHTAVGDGVKTVLSFKGSHEKGDGVTLCCAFRGRDRRLKWSLLADGRMDTGGVIWRAGKVFNRRCIRPLSGERI